jgi:hypothetical protein
MQRVGMVGLGCGTMAGRRQLHPKKASGFEIMQIKE